MGWCEPQQAHAEQGLKGGAEPCWERTMAGECGPRCTWLSHIPVRLVHHTPPHGTTEGLAGMRAVCATTTLRPLTDHVQVLRDGPQLGCRQRAGGWRHRHTKPGSAGRPSGRRMQQLLHPPSRQPHGGSGAAHVAQSCPHAQGHGQRTQRTPSSVPASLDCRFTILPVPRSPLAALDTRSDLRYSASTRAICRIDVHTNGTNGTTT